MTLPVPSDDGVGLDENDCVGPAGPKAAHHNPEDAVGIPDARARLLVLENGELLPECHVFKREPDRGPEQAADSVTDRCQDTAHHQMVLGDAMEPERWHSWSCRWWRSRDDLVLSTHRCREAPTGAPRCAASTR